MIHPIILAGGTGSRLWPLSRKSYPKQFTKLLDGKSLFQNAVEQVSGASFTVPIILTHSEFRFIADEQLKEIGVTDAQIILEPHARDTAPAILTAALSLSSKPDDLMLVMPTDVAVDGSEKLLDAVQSGANLVKSGGLAVFGTPIPKSPSGRQKFLEINLAPKGTPKEPAQLHAFHVALDPASNTGAKAKAHNAKYLQSAGIYMFQVQSIIEAFDILAPKLLIPCRAALKKGGPDLNFFRLGEEGFGRAETVAFDAAADDAAHLFSVIPLNAELRDFSSWNSVWQDSAKDEGGNALSGTATAIDCKNSQLRSENSDIHVVGIGLENITAVAMGDAVLVSKTGDNARVKDAVATLKIEGHKQAETFPRDHRPWGYFETLSLGRRFQVKRIMVHPGAALSLQSHVHRAEHWVVVEGSAQVTVDDSVSLITENQSVYIPLGAVHRLENPGKVPLHLIEVQSGSYLGEDDIKRYEDIYAREDAA